VRINEKALKGRDKGVTPLQRFFSFWDWIPRAVPWAGLRSHLWCADSAVGQRVGHASVARPRFLLVVVTVLVCSLSARAADEDGLLELWKQQMEMPDDHEAVIKACREFATAHAGDPLLPVVRGFEEWRMLRAGQQAEAFKMIEADLVAPAGSVNDGSRRLALGWMSRADREQVLPALQAYYRKEAAYPKTLEQLAAHPKLKAQPQPPWRDRFGKPWDYQLTGFAKLKGFTDQKYSLRCAVLGNTSELKTAVKLPYASRISAVPQQVIPAPGNTQAVKFKLAGSTAVVGVGQATGDLHVAFVGAKIIVVCDYTHWKILPRP
jgi:hypothetical protein